ncbi:MAG: hypothetical protein WBE72_09450 [Terracidiphilus sp.]
MGEIADYFRREQYITRRLSFVILGTMAFLTPFGLANAHGRLSARALVWILIAAVAWVAVVVVYIVRRARARFPRSSSADDATLDDWTRKKLRRRIRLLEFFVAVYALVLVYGLSQTRSGPWLGLIAGMGFNVLMQVALIKAIRRLRKKLQVATGADLGSARPEPRT